MLKVIKMNKPRDSISRMQLVNSSGTGWHSRLQKITRLATILSGNIHIHKKCKHVTYVINQSVNKTILKHWWVDSIVYCTSPETTSSLAIAERPRELGDFKKARVNAGTNNHCLKDSHKCLLCRWQTASYGNQTVCSTRPSCYIHLSKAGVINIAADHQMFIPVSYTHLTLPTILRV